MLEANLNSDQPSIGLSDTNALGEQAIPNVDGGGLVDSECGQEFAEGALQHQGNWAGQQAGGRLNTTPAALLTNLQAGLRVLAMMFDIILHFLKTN